MTDETPNGPTDRPDEYLAPADASDLAARIREAIGAAPDETVEISTPQFERRDGVEVEYIPTTEAAFDALKHLSSDELLELGLRRWSDDLWLFPAEWFPHIPPSYEVHTINHEEKAFTPGETDNDRRFGVLPYGIVVPGTEPADDSEDDP